MTAPSTVRGDMRTAVALANRGRDATAIARAISKKPGGRGYWGSVEYRRRLEEKGLDDADAYAWRTACSAIDFVTSNPPIKDRSEAMVRLSEIEGLATATPWAVYGAGLRRTLEAVFVVAERVGSLRLGLSQREWAELSGRSRGEIERCRDRLIALGWLARTRRNHGTRSHTYKLTAPADPSASLTSDSPPIGGDMTGAHSPSAVAPRVRPPGDHSDRAWLAHDAFRPNALGDAGWYVLTSLQKPLLVRELSLVTGYDLRYSALFTTLEKSGLVETDDDEIVTRAGLLPARLDRLAQDTGTAGLLEMTKELHASERQAYQEQRQTR